MVSSAHAVFGQPSSVGSHHTPTESYTTPHNLLGFETIFDPHATTSHPSHQPAFAAPPAPAPMLFDRPTPAPEWTPAKDPPSRIDESEEEDDSDPLIPGSVDAPWDKMLSLAEAARLKADGHMLEDPNQEEPAVESAKRKAASARGDHPFDYSEPKRKKGRNRGAMTEEQTVNALPQTRGDHVHAFPDPVELGYCSEERGKELFDLWVLGLEHPS